MRKYQQLCLVVISLVSIIILLMYRSENSRLKYVLEVVNFFGRSDNAIVRLENTTKIYIQNYDLANPIPVWTRIGTDFHVYSTFWQNNTMKAGGLESISLVAGIGNVRFQCEMEFENGKSQRGKFIFTREDVMDELNDANSENFIIYTFICKINRDFGYPKKIVFIDTNSHSRHAVNVRSNRLKPDKQFLTVCLNLAQIEKKTKLLAPDNNRLLQFFYHHSFIGVDNFLVYDADDLVSTKVRQILFKNGININVLPYNFPFESHHPRQVQRILEMDCLLRTKFSSKYTIVSTPSDFLYTDANLKSTDSPLKLLKKYSVDKNLFELTVRTICLDKAVTQLAHNNRSRIESVKTTFSLYKPDFKFDDDSEKVRVEEAKIVVHRYVSCADDTAISTLDWRTTVSSSFLEYYDSVAREVKIMCSQEL